MLKEEVEVFPVSDKLLIWLFQLIIKKYSSLNTYKIKADRQLKKGKGGILKRSSGNRKDTNKRL